MGLVDTRRMLTTAQKEKFAIGAFNIENMEMAQAVIEVAEETVNLTVLFPKMP